MSVKQTTLIQSGIAYSAAQRIDVLVGPVPQSKSSRVVRAKRTRHAWEFGPLFYSIIQHKPKVKTAVLPTLIFMQERKNGRPSIKNQKTEDFLTLFKQKQKN